MAKKYIIYANGKDLAQVPVVQNEVGKYYRNSAGTYYKPTLANFDNASLPSGYKTYVGGSHAKYISNPLRHPLDFSLVAGTVITANFDVYIKGFTLADGSWCKAQMAGTSTMLGFVHTYQWASIGLVKAGQPICKIAPKSVTTFDPHLHMDEWTGLKIRDLILTGDFKMADTLKIGDKVRIVGGDMNLRMGAGTGFTNNVKTIKEGAVVQIKDGIRTSQNKLFYGKGSTLNVNDTYQWIDVIDAVGATGWIAITNRVQLVHGNTSLTKLDGTSPSTPTPPPVIEPVDPCKELKEALVASQGALKLSQERVEFLEDDKKTWDEEIKKLETEVSGAKDEAKEWKRQYTEVVTELNELKAGHWTKKLRDEIVALWNKYKEAILKLIKGE